MSVLDSPLSALSSESFFAPNLDQPEVETQSPLNQELVIGDYEGNAVFALGKTAIRANHWLGLVRLGGFHLIFTDMQCIRGSYTSAITEQLALADKFATDNPGFIESLDDDVLRTREVIHDGYLLSNRSIVDYVWLGCEDHRTHSRMSFHPDSKNEHVEPGIRRHTLQVARAIVGIS